MNASRARQTTKTRPARHAPTCPWRRQRRQRESFVGGCWPCRGTGLDRDGILCRSCAGSGLVVW